MGYGAEVNKADNDGYTPLHLACLEGKPDITKLLTEHEALADLSLLKYIVVEGDKGLVEAINNRLSSDHSFGQDPVTLHIKDNRGIENIRFAKDFVRVFNLEDLAGQHVEISFDNFYILK
ncbi:MAG: ankyrin repeat domain-containing protein [Rickettsiaceae bacterium]|nr:ankyrin repeat domain-containing protein [Rickettsiaceae bacterium]